MERDCTRHLHRWVLGRCDEGDFLLPASLAYTAHSFCTSRLGNSRMQVQTIGGFRVWRNATHDNDHPIRTDGAKICPRKQRTKYDRRYGEGANRARRGSFSGKPERHTRENFHTHDDSSPLTFGRHEEPMRNPSCTGNKGIGTRREISQSATICRIFLGGKPARSRSPSSSTQGRGPRAHPDPPLTPP